MTIIDCIQLQFTDRVGKGEFLDNAIISVNVPRPFLLNIYLTAINLVADHGAQVLQSVHPRERVTTQVHARKISGFS